MCCDSDRFQRKGLVSKYSIPKTQTRISEPEHNQEANERSNKRQGRKDSVFVTAEISGGAAECRSYDERQPDSKVRELMRLRIPRRSRHLCSNERLTRQMPKENSRSELEK
eukprot:scaffold86114_cov44-Cyclotella_meneghiniana.AAC.1